MSWFLSPDKQKQQQFKNSKKAVLAVSLVFLAVCESCWFSNNELLLCHVLFIDLGNLFSLPPSSIMFFIVRISTVFYYLSIFLALREQGIKSVWNAPRGGYGDADALWSFCECCLCVLAVLEHTHSHTHS